MLFQSAKITLLYVLLSQDTAPAEYRFATALYDHKDDKFAALARDEYRSWLRRWPDGDAADDVSYRVGKLYEREKDYRRAVLWYLKVPYLYPRSLRLNEALDDGRVLVKDERRFAAQRERYLAAFDFKPEQLDGQARHRAYVGALLDVDDPELRLDIAAEVRDYLARYPDGSDDDRVQIALGELLLKAEETWAAIAAFAKVEFLYPASPATPTALLKAADATWKPLDDPVEAQRRYERVSRDYADSPEAPLALYRMGEVAQKELKRYQIALRNFDEVADRYPASPYAVDALLAKARICAEHLDEPQRAVATYDDLAKRFAGDERVPRALELAAEIDEKKLDDPRAAVEHLVRLAKEYAADEAAPEALYRAAELCEKELGDTGRARELYAEVVSRFAGTKPAKKAQDRLSKE